MRELLKDKTFSEERALYNSKNIHLINCKFQGEEDGESALKESRNIIIEDTLMDLRYPLWHDYKVALIKVTMTSNCRAALWYSKNINIRDSQLHGIKALRECKKILIETSNIKSPEFGWKSKNISINDCALISEYAFLESKNINLTNVNFEGKYAFQYVNNLIIDSSVLNTKDAFWHAKNVVVKNSIIKGEYLGWYSENLTFINCHIVGTQPLCYCKKLTLIDCTMEKCDLSFEYSNVNAKIKGEIESIKNPLDGVITCDNVKEIIFTKDAKIPCLGKVVVNNKIN